MPYIMTKRL